MKQLGQRTLTASISLEIYLLRARFLLIVLFSGGKGVSLVVGTGIGGLLAEPSVSYPSLFSDSGVFGR